jgi:hypothetical protein
MAQVMGELDGRAHKRILTHGGIAAIALVTLLYMLANVAAVRVLGKCVEILLLTTSCFSDGRSSV